MHIYRITTFLVVCLLFWGCSKPKESSQGKDFTSKVDANSANDRAVQYPFFDQKKNPLPVRFELLPAGEVIPQGWMYDLMKEDITTGFVSKLDKLAPDVMQGDDLYNTTRRQDPRDIPDVGDQVLTGADWEISMQWWSGESLGHWWDGYVRNAYLTKDEEAMARSKEIVEYLMSTQDEDGYFGIYGPNMRFQHAGSNGELWTKTTVLRMMVGYYEFTGDERVLKFVEKAMGNTMKHYNKGVKGPFQVAAEYGGVTHGLMLTDVCEMLYRITGKEVYRDYAVFLYEDFSENPINRAFNDACYGYLMEKDALFQSHSVHTYEHLRTVIFTYYATGYPEMKEAYNSALAKLANCILPSGAGFGNEWLNKEMAKPAQTGAEVCGMNELKDFYLSAFQKSGDPAYADAAEKLTFNALLGARNQDGSGITYCKTDNCRLLNGKAPQTDFEETDPRYKYSPTHADAAICCNPSYARYFPYYVSSMWMKADNGLVAALYGPSTLQTTVEEAEITIDQSTDYPFSDNISMEMTTSTPTTWTLYLRKPAWVAGMKVSVEGAKTVEEEGYVVITKQWHSGDKVHIRFEQELMTKKYHDGDWYAQRGPLVYAYEIPHRVEQVKTYQVMGFSDYHCFAENDRAGEYALVENKVADFQFYAEGSPLKENALRVPYLYVKGMAINTRTREPEDIELIPMGHTTLRRVTFPVY